MNIRRKSNSAALLFMLLILNTHSFPQKTLDARESFQEGSKAMTREDPYTAVGDFRTALSINPNYLEARTGLAEALFRLGEYQNAAQETKRAQKLAPENRNVKLLNARILTASGNYEKALGIYSQLLIQRPHDPQATRGLAEIYAIRGQREKALALFNKGLVYAPGDRRILLQQILIYNQNQEKSKAEKTLINALALYPDNISVRLSAIRHHSLYENWNQALRHLEIVKKLFKNQNDPRYSDIIILESEIYLEQNNPIDSLDVLGSLGILQNNTEIQYLMARTYRAMNMENAAQNVLRRILKKNTDDEIARLYRDEYLISNSAGFEKDRKEATDWYLKRGKEYEDNFYYEHAYSDFRRARLIYNSNPHVWIAYINNLRKRGFTENYIESLKIALQDIPSTAVEYSKLRKRLDMLEHSRNKSLGEEWDISEPWLLKTAEWKLGIFMVMGTNSLEIHHGAAKTLSLYLADILDSTPEIILPADKHGRNIEVYIEKSLPVVFRKARNKMDYFLIVSFNETEKKFQSYSELYIARTGEKIGKHQSSRKGSSRVSDALHETSKFVTSIIPKRMKIISVKDDAVLLDKGSWQGVETNSKWIALKANSARPSLNESGIIFPEENYLGTVEINAVSEPLSEGKYFKDGQFDFISPGAEAFLLPSPAEEYSASATVNVYIRNQLLAVP